MWGGRDAVDQPRGPVDLARAGASVGHTKTTLIVWTTQYDMIMTTGTLLPDELRYKCIDMCGMWSAGQGPYLVVVHSWYCVDRWYSVTGDVPLSSF